MSTDEKHKAEAKARNILDAYFEGGLPRELDGEIMAWIMDRLEEGSIDDILLDKWVERITIAERPDNRTRWALRRAMVSLGFPDDIREKLSDDYELPAVSAPAAPIVKKRRNPIRSAMRIAAIMIPALLLVEIGWMLFKPDEEHTAIAELIVTVSNGLQKQVTLSDNSKVWINSGTTLEYDGEVGDNRIARLDGEAYFKVAKGNEKSFIVKTSDTEIEVTGTEFNVKENADDNITHITLTEGSITVEAGGDIYELSAGEWLEYDGVNDDVTMGVSDTAFEDWRSPIQSISNRSLDDILEIVSDYYGYELVMNTDLTSEEYSVKFQGNDPIENLLAPLSISSGEFSYSVESGKLIIN